MPEVKATPARSDALRWLAERLGDVDQFARKPFGYSNPPVALVSDLLGLPGLQKTTERLAYGEPLTTGKGMATRLRPDTEEALFAVQPALPAVGALGRAAGRGAMVAGRAGERLAERVVPAIMERGGAPAHVLADLAQGAGAHVVKPKGGNWLRGSVEYALMGLKRDADQEAFNFFRSLPVEEKLARINANRTQPLSLGTYEREWLGRHGYSGFDEAGNKAITADEMNALPGTLLNKWLETKLAKYIKNEMATPEDPVRALAERGVLHYTPEGAMNLGDITRTMTNRLPSPLIAEAKAVSPLAKRWEDWADYNIKPRTAGQQLLAEHPYNAETMPWLAKVPPETMVYDLGQHSAHELGLDHLVDELRNALNPQSGLPRELLWKYSDLDKITVPQAVERVHKINEWRAAQKLEADLAKANNAATVLYKDYPDKGFKWVELKAPTAKSVEDLSPEQVTWYNEYLQGGVSPERALQEASKRTQKTLADALKYEGEQMGHCVGGYCGDVYEGRSRIFSLRDKKGQPHVTIEARPSPLTAYDVWYSKRSHLGKPDQEYQEFLDFLQSEKPVDISNEKTRGLEKWYRQWAEQTGRKIEEPPLDLVQIKGKQNFAPKPEYLPYAQDFVKSRPWGEVRDLGNVELYRVNQDFLGDLANFTPSAGVSKQERMDALTRAIQAGDLKHDSFVTRDEWENALRKHLAPPEGFARGGLVESGDYDSARVDKLVSELEAEMNL